MADGGPYFWSASGERPGRCVRRALRVDERVDRQQVAELAEGVDRQRLVEDVLQERLEPGVALAAGAARIGLDGAAAVVEIVQHDRQVLRQLGRLAWRSVFRCATVGPAALTACVPGHRRLAERLERDAPRSSRTAPDRSSSRARLPEDALRLLSGGTLASAVCAELLHRRAQLLEEPGQLVEGGLEGVFWVAVCGRGVVGLDDEPLHLGAVVGQRGEHAVAVHVSVLQRVRIVGQQLEQIVGLGQRGHGASQRGLKVGRAPGETRAELVDDQREALPVGHAHDVVEQVRRRSWSCVWLTGITLPRLQHRAGVAGLALDEVLADQRLRARLAGRVLVELPEARSG